MIKICDFGFAKTWSEEANMFTQIGCVPPTRCCRSRGLKTPHTYLRGSPLLQHPRLHVPRAHQLQEREDWV